MIAPAERLLRHAKDARASAEWWSDRATIGTADEREKAALRAHDFELIGYTLALAANAFTPTDDEDD